MPLAATTAISPADDSVDANNVIITGTGTISSFGACPYPITKQLVFEGGVTLVHSPQMVLLTGGADRVTPGRSVGTYQTLGNGVWVEVVFSTLETVDPLLGTVNSLQSQVATLQSQVATLQSQVATNANNIAINANNIAANTAAIAALQANHAAWINHLETNLNFLYAFVNSHVSAVTKPSQPPSTPP